MYNPKDNQVVLHGNNNPPSPSSSSPIMESWNTMYDDEVALQNNNLSPWLVESERTMYNPNEDQVRCLHNNNHPPPPHVSVESWTRQHDKIFETALVTYPEESLNRWENIAMLFPGRTPGEMRARYDILVYDVSEIETGRVELPRYTDDDDDDSAANACSRGKPWTEEEHRRFLAGLEKYGKGDWRSISRKFVVTRSSTQVASHAQKYFQRLSVPPKERKRISIHDITSVDAAPPLPPPPVTNYFPLN